MENYKDLFGQAKQMFADAQAILTKDGGPTDEEKANVDKMLADAKALQARAMQLKDIKDSMGDIAQRIETKQGPDEEKEKRADPKQFKDWGEYLVAVWQAPQLRKSDVDKRLQKFTEKGEE